MLRPACSSESMRAACSCPRAVGLHAVDGQRREVADVARQAEAGRRQAAGARAEEHEAAVRRRYRGRTARRGASGSRSGSPLRSISRSAGRSASSQTSPSCTSGAPGRAHQRVERVVVLHDQAALDGEGVQERPATSASAARGSARARPRDSRAGARRSRPNSRRMRSRSSNRLVPPAAPAAGRPSPPALAALEEALQVARQEPPLSAGRPAAGHDTRVGPASQGVFTHLEHLGCGRHAQPAAAAVGRPHPSL